MPGRLTYFRKIFLLLFAICLCACSNKEEFVENHVVMSLGRMITTLDPALAADSPTLGVCAAFYDTLIQYQYGSNEYKLEPAMLREMPVLQEDGKSYLCTLRDDLYFQEAPCFPDKASRKVTSSDVVFSLLRLADSRLNSPAYWILRDNVEGAEKFRTLTAKAAADDLTPYDTGISGLKILNPKQFLITGKTKNPRLCYLLALPNCAILSRRAVEYYGAIHFAETPCGSGPYKLQEWKKDHSIILTRNPGYRKEYYVAAEKPEDQKKQLPLADKITCYLVRQNVSSWLMFLQGELDFYTLDGDQFQALVKENGELSQALQDRGIRLLRAPLQETNYIGFHFSDPVLGKNADLRRAVSLAFDKDLRILQSGGRYSAAYAPIPPGTAGHLTGEKGRFGEKNIALAKDYLAKAGYPDGIDPSTGKPLVLTFDQAGTDVAFQQIAELLANDLRAIGIEVRANLNTRPRFQAKLASGDVQLFRYSWCADYPDGQNFLQLFYSGNAGGCNRASFKDEAYDRMYREIEFMEDSPERTKKYQAMARYLQEQVPWIFETHTMAFVVSHSWMKNYRVHDFAYNRWKYFSAPANEREEKRKAFTPLTLSGLR